MGAGRRRHQRHRPRHGSKSKDARQFTRTGNLALFPRLVLPLLRRLFCFAAVSHVFLSRELLLSQVEKMVGLVYRIEKQPFK